MVEAVFWDNKTLRCDRGDLAVLKSKENILYQDPTRSGCLFIDPKSCYRFGVSIHHFFGGPGRFGD